MSPRVFLFGLWCLLLLLASAAANYYAWSPFADGSRRSGATIYGPTHK
ncbi:hypothetical protein OMW55_03525 [Sphingomonas sp. BN140010]|uniref:Uncharacterized protein n=1 Tax=Sphingomonas arvum TaxID=2992113 RepID=A0ABT3JCS2_9SPHN|nr:hypothetical protein [Sphingomonas sp. BN140010]MCW3796875.1 hypothetical protein [Sphingomonas sp. BN140010]